VVALGVVVERAEPGDELREQVADELVEQVAGRLAEQRVPAQVDLERALRIAALRRLLVDQHARAGELGLVAVARRQLDDLQRDVPAEEQDLLQQLAGHHGRVAQQALDHLERRGLRELLHEGALPVPDLDQLQELEPLQGLAHRGPVDPEGLRQLALVGELGPGRDRAREDLRAELLEDPVDAGLASHRLDAHGSPLHADLGCRRSDHEKVAGILPRRSRKIQPERDFPG